MLDDKNSVTMQGAVCAPPLAHGTRIVMGHGSGGKMTHDLIANHFVASFDNPALRAGDDAGIVKFVVSLTFGVKPY